MAGNSGAQSVRSTQFTEQTSAEAHQLALEKARADAEERRAKALMGAVTARLILDSIDAENIDLGVILDGAVARVAMKVLNGETPIRNGSEAAAVIREFTQARVRMLGGADEGGGYSGEVSDEERRQNVLELKAAVEVRAREMEEAVAETHGASPA